MILIDNYDSFTYNLSQYLAQLGCEHRVIKNDEMSVNEVHNLRPLGVLISPGPGTPDESGISLDVIKVLKYEYCIYMIILSVLSCFFRLSRLNLY